MEQISKEIKNKKDMHSVAAHTFSETPLPV